MRTRFFLASAMIGAAVLCAGAGPALAKRRPAANEICFSASLSKTDRSDCKKQMSAQTTEAGRSKVQKEFKHKVAEAKAAAPPAPKK
jgi:hypothetical protein